ncbi:uncharacterized protein F5Z01DRAFT_360103 [Emericellopsis atlantica]|uniref:Uncharacterized protein n=1 Tax=Emericellopsis atlantica TaxID=2614577 RepID=A0A9P7ZFL1_9HYPO|nr:uncharacterized protein F5Z01DRAFT_360103 [Emericellopsis atlantica]KAG9250563.1 hypothetical protein F5Z01DRAFT_360103 [Emericellopsis atlantica]
MATQFLFVDQGAQHDRIAKRQIRQHVMKGKNAGRKIKRPSRLDIVSHGKEQKQWYPGAADETFSIAFQLVGLPVEVSPQSLRVIHEFFHFTTERMYPMQLGLSLDDSKRMWLKLFFADTETFECNLAMMQAANETYLGRGETSPRALTNLAKTFARVQQRILSPDALADSTVTIVISLVNQEHLRGDLSGATIHIAGLRRMVELRGGLDQLEHNPPLLMKICKMDLVYALQYGGQTAFFRDNLAEVRQTLRRQGCAMDREEAAAMVRHPESDLGGALREVLVDALSLGHLFNQDRGAGSVGLFAFQEIFLSIGFRLLRTCPMDGPPLVSPLRATCHTGLLLFAMSIFLRHDSKSVLDCTLATQRLKDTLARTICDEASEWRLWLMMMGAIWTLGDDQVAAWLRPMLSETASYLRLTTWTEARARLQRFPWINKLHDQPGREVWDQLRGNV